MAVPIRPKDLPPLVGTVPSNAALIVDTGAGVYKATPDQLTTVSSLTFPTLAGFKAGSITNKTQILQDPSIEFGIFYWETADAPYTADNVNVIKADSTALSVGAWVRQSDTEITYEPARTNGARPLSQLTGLFDISDLVYWTGNSIVEAPYGPPNLPAPTVLESQLVTAGKMVSVYNEGGSGETAWQIMTRTVGDIGSDGELRPKILIVGPAGVNSFRRVSDDPTRNGIVQVKAQYQAMFDAAAAIGCKVICITDLPWKGYVDADPAYSWDITKQDLTDQLNAWIMAYPTNVDVAIDAYTAFESSAGSDTMKPAYDLGDHLHINQPGRNMLVDLVRPDTAALLPSVVAAALRFVGDFYGDQDVSTKSSPQFNGMAVGRNQRGFEVFGPAFEVIAANGNRAIAVNTKYDPARGRGVFIDGTMPLTFQSLGEPGSGWRVQAAMGIDDYGTGTGTLYLGNSNGAAIVKAAWVNGGNLGAGTKNPSRRFVVSNAGAEGLEFGPGNANGDASGSVKLLSYNRATAAVINLDIQSAQTDMKDGSGLICITIANGRNYIRTNQYADDAAAGAAGLTSGQFYHKPDNSVWRKG